MKVIDLLNKIAKGEEVPEKIKYEGRDMFWCEPCKIYEIAEVEQNELCGKDLYNILDNLNDEVEILDEEEFEDIEELEIKQNGNINYYIENEYGTKCSLTKHSKIIADKINQLIKNQKKLIDAVNELKRNDK